MSVQLNKAPMPLPSHPLKGFEEEFELKTKQDKREILNERFLILLLDVLFINIAFLVYKFFREQIPHIAFSEQATMYALPMIAMTIFWLGLFWLFGLYRTWQFGSRYEEIVTVIQAITVGSIFIFILIFADDVLIEEPSGIVRPYSQRIGSLIYWALLCLLLPIGRVVDRTIRRRRLVKGSRRRYGVIIGTGNRARKLAADIVRHPALGVDIRGFVYETSDSVLLQADENRIPTQALPQKIHPLNDSLSTLKGELNILGTIDDLDSLVSKERIKEVLIAAETASHHDLVKIIGKCEGKNLGIKVLPDMYDVVAGVVKTTQIYGTPLLDLTPPLLSPLSENLKRLSDILVSLLVLICGSPIWLIISLLVRFDTKASTFYKQIRIGLHGKEFYIYKFRTMRADAEKDGPKLTTKDDPRITPLGKQLRKYRIDEFPQFWNVLKGDMSLVGPRPERPHFIEQITKVAPQYRRLHRVKPGITSWGQVKYGYAETVEEMLERMKYDLYYLENMSLKMDVKIILATVYVVVTGRGQ
ncbi:MAG: sugar transferase [Chloroherpetonaceae bacterium]|nr:sugar transferase [Chloroherpetonaceae bacterium]